MRRGDGVGTLAGLSIASESESRIIWRIFRGDTPCGPAATITVTEDFSDEQELGTSRAGYRYVNVVRTVRERGRGRPRGIASV